MEEKFFESLEISALGGLEQVGMNCSFFKKRGEIIIVDAGIRFPSNSESLNLVNGIIPNFDYLKERKEQVKALFVTHGHQDHIGAIPYLLSEFPHMVVYGSSFSISLIKQSISLSFEKGLEKTKRFVIFNDSSIFRTGEFIIKFFRVCHSIPESFGIIIETIKEKAVIVLTGDFKID